MKITFVNRKPRAYGNFSIESYFSILSKYLKEKAEISHWVAPFHSTGFLNRLLSVIALGKINRSDIYHVTGDTNFLVLGLSKGKTVLTFHDIGFLSETKGIKKWILKKFWVELPMKRADAVTTVSVATKNDILRFFPKWRKKIHVIPTVIDPRFTRSDKAFNAVCPTILLIGSAPNKNLKRVLKATKGLNVQLSLVAELDAEEKALLAGQSYEVESSISFESLLEKYRSADIVMLCSTLEGFGMPIIEAQATGRVVLTSNCSSMPDVAGNGALLVDPISIKSMREGLEKLISDASLREKLIQAGFENVKRFLPETISEMYYEVYSSLVKRRK